MLSRYRKYIEYLESKLAGMFESQKAFIKCKEGCAYCCKEGEYPISELEYVDLMFCFNELDEDLKNKVKENIINLLKRPREKMYECPFLVDNRCSIYQSRAIICRTFGLMSYNKEGRKKIPFCVEKGLNYSEVFDEETSKIVSSAKDGTEPLAFNVDRTFLRSSDVEKEFGIFFGEDKPLVEWLAEEDWS